MIDKLKRLWYDQLATYTYRSKEDLWEGYFGWGLYGKKGLGLLREPTGWRIMFWWWQCFISTEGINR